MHIYSEEEIKNAIETVRPLAEAWILSGAPHQRSQGAAANMLIDYIETRLRQDREAAAVRWNTPPGAVVGGAILPAGVAASAELKPDDAERNPNVAHTDDAFPVRGRPADRTDDDKPIATGTDPHKAPVEPVELSEPAAEFTPSKSFAEAQKEIFDKNKAKPK